MMTRFMTGAKAMVKCLEEQDVKVVFGYPGAAICPFYDELFCSDIHHVLVRHEANAGHSASGYARQTGDVGVCLVTSGPGATNLLTAIATAYADSIPLVCITGQVSSDQIGCDVFQEVDITGAAEPFVKYSYLVKKAEDIPRIFREAFYIAGTGRKGPVLIDVPIDISKTEIEFYPPKEINLRSYKPTIKGNSHQLKRIFEAIKTSEKPLICAGGGIIASNASEELRNFAEINNIPVVTTMMGLGVLPSEHKLNFGMLGMHGVKSANTAVHKCDTIIIIGARVGDRAVTSPQFLAETTKIIHIDIDPAEIGKNIATDIPLVGDCKNILAGLIELSEKADKNQFKDWILELSEIKNTVPCENSTAGYINPKMFLRKLSEKMPKDTTCVADVGQNQIWACNNFQIKDGNFFTSGGMGTMGYSIPCAIGVKMADPKKAVVAICGDGSFQMQMMELATIVAEKLPIAIIIMRNNRLGMVRELQTKFYNDDVHAVKLTDGNPDFAALARAYGIDSMSITTEDEIDSAIKFIKNAKSPCLVEVNVYKYESTL